MRLILFTGAGGAGVTTLAAATAVAIAAAGRVVRLLGRHAAALDVVLGPRAALPAALAPAPHVPEPVFGADTAGVAEWLQALLTWAGLEGDLAEEVPLLPGADALTALLRGSESGDTTVVDLGPVAEALPLLHLLLGAAGGVLEAWPFAGGSGLAAPLLSRLVDLPRPNKVVQQAGRRTAERLRGLRSLLRDSAATSLRVVLPADGRAAHVVREARTVCGLHGIALDAVIDRGAGRSDSGSHDGSCLEAAWRRDPPVGPAALLGLAEVYGSGSPAERLREPSLPSVSLLATGAELVLPLPQRPAEEFQVSRRGARLEVRAGRWRRALILPEEVRAMRGRRAWHDGAVFRVIFER